MMIGRDHHGVGLPPVGAEAKGGFGVRLAHTNSPSLLKFRWHAGLPCVFEHNPTECSRFKKMHSASAVPELNSGPGNH